MKTFLLILMLSLIACFAGLADTVVSEPVGFVTVNLGAPAVGSSTGKLIGIPFHRASVFQGSNILAAANSLQSTAPGWVSGQFTSVVHLARLRSGACSGRYFTITANTADTLTVLASNATFGVGDTFEIFPAHTLGTLFGTSTPSFGLQTGSTESVADLVRCIVGGTWVSYFHNGNQWRTPADPTSQNNTVIPPDQGVFVVRRSATSLDITLQGAVSITAESGSITGTGLGVLGPRFPLPTTLASLGLHSLSGWRKARSASLADTVLFWNGGDWSVFYHSGSSWRKAGASSSQDSSIIPAGEAALIRRKEGASGSLEITTIGLPFAYPTP